MLGDYVGSTLWGAAFEDLLATELPDGRNLADEYLRRRGWKESSATRAYIEGLRRSVISLHEVSGLVPGESMLLRDLVRGGEPVRVAEKRGSAGLRQWDRIATRVVTLRDRAVISGTLMVFGHAESEALLARLRRAPASLPQAAPAITNAWLDAALRAALGRDRPELVNSEGDPLEFHQVHFPLRTGVSAARIREALAGIPALRQEKAGFWNWVAEQGAARRATPGRKTAQSLITTMEDGALVLGTLALKGRRLTLEANSAARAERGRALLAAAVGELVGPPLVECTGVEEMLAHPRRAAPPSGLPPEEERAMVQRTLDEHYRRVLDEPLPALGGRSPRKAASTPKGREQVAEWLKSIENHMARVEPDSPMAGYETGWLWRELGLEALRR